MKTILCIVLSVCICMTSGFRLKEKRSTSESFSGTIGYTNTIDGSSASRSSSAGSSTSQTVTIKDQEVRLTIANNMDVVLDYNQMLLFARRSSENVCIVTQFNQMAVPPLDFIREMLSEYAAGKTFQMPTGHLQMDLQKSKNQQTPFMYELSKELCNGRQIINYEPKQEIDTVQELSGEKALAVQHHLRPKREVGWGEIILIVIVVIILL